MESGISVDTEVDAKQLSLLINSLVPRVVLATEPVSNVRHNVASLAAVLVAGRVAHLLLDLVSFAALPLLQIALFVFLRGPQVLPPAARIPARGQSHWRGFGLRIALVQGPDLAVLVNHHIREPAHALVELVHMIIAVRVFKVFNILADFRLEGALCDAGKVMPDGLSGGKAGERGHGESEELHGDSRSRRGSRCLDRGSEPV